MTLLDRLVGSIQDSASRMHASSLSYVDMQLEVRIKALRGETYPDSQILRLYHYARGRFVPDFKKRVECDFAGYAPLVVSTEEWAIFSGNGVARAVLNRELEYNIINVPEDKKCAYIDGWALEELTSGRIMVCSDFAGGGVAMRVGDKVRISEIPIELRYD